MCGAGTHMPLGYGRKRRLLSERIAVSVATCDNGTETMVDVRDGSSRRLDVESAARSHRYPAYIGTLPRSTGNDGAHEVARLKALDPPGLFGFRAREPVLIHAAHLPRPMSGGGDVQWDDTTHVQRLRCTLPN